MCGICGFTNFSGKIKFPEKVIEDMKFVLRHRGPDESGTFADENIFLGHTRLVVIDLKTGKQPISNEDGSIWVIFNGEIYNYKELKNDLISRHTFVTNTDTEVIVHLYEEFGNNCVDKLDGMFAFCIWDGRKKKLFCARDRFGKKPFYYTISKGEFIFSSELKGILQYPGVDRQVDTVSLSRYLAYEYIPSPGTIFRGIHKLPAAHCLVFENGNIKIQKYWDFELKRINKLSIDEYIENIEFLFQNAVHKRLMSDVPLGVFLSGGVDSSLVAYFASKIISPGRIKSFSIGFDEPSFDESGYADTAAKFLVSEHRQKSLDCKTTLKLLFEIIGKLDEPFADASIVPTYFLSNFAKEHVTVALSGDGGDELFCGYDTFPASKMSLYYEKLPSLLEKLIVRNTVKRIPVSFKNFSFDFKIKQFLKGMDYDRCFRNQVWLGAFSPEQQASIFNEQTGISFSAQEIYKDISDHKINTKASGYINELIYFYIKFYLQEDILTKIDRAGMMNSLEMRCPFLDIELFEFVNSVPVNLKLHGLTTKYILRKMLFRKFPKKIVSRRKKGFNMPIAQWLRGPLKPLMLEVLSKNRMEMRHFFKYTYVKRIIDEHLSGKADNRKQLWTLIMFGLWFDKWARDK